MAGFLLNHPLGILARRSLAYRPVSKLNAYQHTTDGVSTTLAIKINLKFPEGAGGQSFHRWQLPPLHPPATLLVNNVFNGLSYLPREINVLVNSFLIHNSLENNPLCPLWTELK